MATRLNLASALARLGRTHDAVVHFQEALRLEPDSIEGLNNLAWLLATCNDATIRDGARAVQLAEHACVLTDHKQGFLLGTLAAAYAEAGRFALWLSSRAIRMLRLRITNWWNCTARISRAELANDQFSTARVRTIEN